MTARELRLGPLRLTAPTALAPMAALTDSIFRRLIKRQGGCGFVITEMVPARALLSGSQTVRDLLAYTEEERPIGGQIMGGNPDLMADAARVVEGLGFDFVDVNMGCPSRKVTSGGGGSALMRDPPAAARVLQAITRAVRIPLSVKIRAGWSDECLNAPQIARIAEESGAQLVSVHARTRVDAYRPGVREEILVETREAVSIPVLANGDIRDQHGAAAVMARTRCDGVMSGRGAIANPWLLRDIARGGPIEESTTGARHWILDHFRILAEELPERRLLGKLRTFAGWYTRGLLQGSRLRQRIASLRSAAEFAAAVEEFFAETAEGENASSLTRSHQEHRP